MSITHSNRLRLEAIRTMPIGEIAALPADLCALLQEEAEEAPKAATSLADWLDGAIALRYGDRAEAPAGRGQGHRHRPVRRRTASRWSPTCRRRSTGTSAACGRGRAHPRQRRRPRPVRRHRDQSARAQVRRLAGEHPRRLRAGAHREDRQADLPAFAHRREELIRTAGQPDPQGRAGTPSAPGQRPAVSQPHRQPLEHLDARSHRHRRRTAVGRATTRPRLRSSARRDRARPPC